jgi:hypothetical protein
MNKAVMVSPDGRWFEEAKFARRGQSQNQAAITKAYADIANERRALLAPVGAAWQAALEADPTLPFHQNDDSHPTAAGSHLAACVFYGLLYGQSSEGLPGRLVVGNGDCGRVLVSLTRDRAALLQRIAWQTVQSWNAAACPASSPTTKPKHLRKPEGE